MVIGPAWYGHVAGVFDEIAVVEDLLAAEKEVSVTLLAMVRARASALTVALAGSDTTVIWLAPEPEVADANATLVTWPAVTSPAVAV